MIAALIKSLADVPEQVSIPQKKKTVLLYSKTNMSMLPDMACTRKSQVFACQ